MNPLPMPGNHITSSKAADSQSKEVAIPLCLVFVKVVLGTNKQEKYQQRATVTVRGCSTCPTKKC